ncbi:MAG: mechanosensitive ion channel [Planctomycetes bacterium]|nr:mechanosensitive ion channel [Planctomycetota bacterium]
MPDLSEARDSLFRDWNDISFFWIGLTFVVAWLAVGCVRFLARWTTRRLPSRYRFYILPWVPVLRLVIIVVAVVEIVPQLIRPTASNLIAVFGAAGVAIGFAFKDYVSSLIAGLVLVYERPYRVGDWVKIGGDYGEVRAVGMRAVELVTPGDTVVTVPHNKMWDTAIHNSNGGQRDMQCVAQFFVAPMHDGDSVRRKLLDVAISSAYLHFDRPVVVVAAQLPWGTRYLIRAYPIECREQFAFIADLTIRGNAALLKIGATLVIAPPIADASES